ncbi:isopeptide-forming domain-containing fimbrial protein [Wenzhouxiangella sp. XN79A]|uniref:DUF7507 domain-containing protein n=2 Tax=Wenzhouxiangella sp. XN79A TaxID=2724193 RepID=UPI00197E4009
MTAGETITYTLTATISDAALTSPLVLTDTLGAGLGFGALGANPGGYVANTAGNPLTFELPSGTVPGTYEVSYTVTVDADASGNVGNQVVPTGGGDPDPECPSCTTDHPVADPAIEVSKSANPASGSQVLVGQTITYTLTATISDAATTAPLELSDTLGAGLTFGAVTAAGAFTPNTAGNPLTFTLPSGTVPGVYTVSYTATVDSDASGTVGNSVVVTGNGGDPDPVCTSCTTSHPVGDPSIVLIKTSSLNDTNGNSFADAGEVIDYTLTATNDGDVVLTGVEIDDPLIATLSCTPAQPATLNPTEQLVCTGSYTVTAADIAAGGSVTNTATVTAPDPSDPVGNPPLTDTDSTSTPVVPAPALTLIKIAVLDDTNGSTFADVGETIDYTLTATNDGNIALSDVVIDDPMLGALSCTPAQPSALAPTEQLVCTASYTVTQTDLDNGPDIVNIATVAAPDPIDPIDNPPLGDSDTETVPTDFTASLGLVKSITVGSPYSAAGQTIGYQLTATNTGSVTLDNVVISDPLATIGTCTPAQPTSLAPGATLVCDATYVVTQADIDNGSFTNVADVDGQDPNGDPVNATDSAVADGPAPAPALLLDKALIGNADEDGSGNVTLGDTLTYGLVATNTGNITLTDVTISDPMLGGLVCTPLQPASLLPTQALTCAGDYVVQAGDVAAGSIVNTGTASSTQTGPVQDVETVATFGPAVVVTKAATPASGSVVTAGQSISYTLTATVSDAPLTEPLVLADTLDVDLSFGTLTANPGGFATNTTGSPLLFELSTGTAPGVYAVTYTATVNVDATGTVGNSVVIAGNGGDPDPECPSCDTDHPVADPVIVVAKTSDPVSGSEVIAGQTLSYTLTATISDAATTAPLVLTDTLGAGLTFGAVAANPGGFTPDTAGNPLTFTLPSGTVPGTYLVTYTAVVDADATGSVGNSVVPTGGGDPDPECPSCDTDHPVADPAIVVTKSANPASGTEVFAGQQVAYTLTATVSDAATTAPLVLTDTLGAGLVFDAVTANPGGFTANTSGNPLTFTLAAGAVPGTFEVTYTVTVAASASGSVGNLVVPTGGGDPDPECPSCDTDHPVGELGLNLVKSASLNDANGNGLADAGEVIDYTLTATNNSTVALPGTTISDPMLPVLSCTPPQPATLNPGDQLSCTGSYTVLPSDITAGTDIVNTAITEAPDPITPANPPLTDSDSASIGICTLDSGDVTGQIWHDLDRDNVIDPGEPPLTSFVTLGPPGAPAADLLITTADPATGVYSFAGVPEGTYELRVLEAYLGNNFDLYAVQPPVRTIAVVRCGTVVEDFNFAAPLDGVVGDFVWFDVNEDQTVDEFRDGNGDGVLTQNPIGTPISSADFEWVDLNQNGNPDDGEFRRCGLENVEVRLFDGSGSLVGSRLTNLRGEYFFRGLALDGEYTAVVDDSNPANLVSAQQYAVDGNCLALAPRAPATPPTARGGVVAGCGATSPLSVQSLTLTAAAPVDAGLDFGLICGVAGQLALDKVLTSNADEDGSATVTFGDTLTYTVTATNTGSVALSNVVVTDSRITPSSITCPLLAQGDACVLTGTYSVTAADAQAGEVLNVAGADSDQTDPVETQLIVPVLAPQVVVVKTSDPASGSVVNPGDTLVYTLTATVSGAPLIDPLVLSDTLGAGLTFGTVTNAGAFTPDTGGSPLTFTLPAGIGPGSYAVDYTASVDPDATGTVGNSVVATGGGDPDPECPSCDTEHDVETLLLDKSVVTLDATGPNSWRVEYEMVVTNPGPVDSSYTLTDTLGFTADGVELGDTAFVSTVGGVLAPSLSGGQFTPTRNVPLQVSDAGVPIAAGDIHRYRVAIPLGVIAGQLQNGSCTGASGNGLYNQAELTGPVTRVDDACASIDDSGEVAIRLIKTVELGVDFNGNDFGDVGDVLFYTFEITNIGNQPLTDIQLIDLQVDDLQCLPRASDGREITVLGHDAVKLDGFERGGLGSLSPAASIQCTASHELTALDVARRRVENTATALGTGPNGEVVNSVSTAVYTGFQ